MNQLTECVPRGSGAVSVNFKTPESASGLCMQKGDFFLFFMALNFEVKTSSRFFFFFFFALRNVMSEFQGFFYCQQN